MEYQTRWDEPSSRCAVGGGEEVTPMVVHPDSTPSPCAFPEDHIVDSPSVFEWWSHPQESSEPEMQRGTEIWRSADRKK
jgi:hypothetical protein